MILDSKAIILLAILFFNIIYFFNQKSRIAASLNIIITVFLLIALLSLVVTNQILFKDISFLLMVFLVICVFVIMRQDEIVKSKKDIRRKSFPIGYFLLIFILIVGVFLSTSFLLTANYKSAKNVSKIETIKKIDINNTQLAKKKYESKTSLFNERDLAIKMFKGLSDLIVFAYCVICVIMAGIICKNKNLKKNEFI